jgi:uncharacterized protein YigA (DUF484 family)
MAEGPGIDLVAVDAPEAQPQQPTADEVVGYLRAHPEFLVQRQDLLLDLTPPPRWRGEGVVDLHQHIVRGLREELDAMRSCAREFIDVSRVNHDVQARAHAAVLALLGASGLAETSVVVREEFPRLLGLAAARLCFEREPAHHTIALLRLAALPEGTVEQLVGSDSDIALMSRIADHGIIFDTDAPRVRSAALVRIKPLPGGPVGLLAFGGAQPHDFHPGQAVDVVAFLARVVERYARTWLDRRD